MQSRDETENQTGESTQGQPSNTAEYSTQKLGGQSNEGQSKVDTEPNQQHEAKEGNRKKVKKIRKKPHKTIPTEQSEPVKHQQQGDSKVEEEEVKRKEEAAREVEEELRRKQEEETAEKERKEKEEQQRLENEKREKEEQQRLEQERREKEEHERLENQKRQKEEQERLDRDRREKEEQERLEKERKERQEQQRLEKEKREKQQQQRLEKQKKEKEQSERLERERQERERQQRQQQQRKDKQEHQRQEKEKRERQEEERLQRQRKQQQRLDRERKQHEQHERQQAQRKERQRQQKLEQQRKEKEEKQRLEKQEQERLRREKQQQDRLQKQRRQKEEQLRQSEQKVGELPALSPDTASSGPLLRTAVSEGPSIETEFPSKPKQQDSKPQTKQYSLEDRLRDAVTLKNNGNEQYKAKNYQQAVKLYSQGLRVAHAELFNGADPILYQKMAELNITLLQNIGTSYFSMNNYDIAQKFCAKVIQINPKHFKAHYRRALSLYELQRYDEALDSIKAAYAIDSSVGQVNEAYRKIHTACKEEKEKKKELYKSMFNNSPKKEATTEGEMQEVQVEESGLSTALMWGGLAVAVAAAAVLGFKAWFKN